MSSARTIQEKVVETALAYWRLANAVPPTASEFASWLAQLPSAALPGTGLQQASQSLEFKRYVLETRGYSMRAFMRAHMTPEEVAYWVDDNDGGGPAG